MNQIYFDENGLKDLQSVADALFSDSQDPRDLHYKRILIRPKINWAVILLHCVCPVLVLLLMRSLLLRVGLASAATWGICLGALLIYAVIMAKRCALCLIRIYQRYAPDSIRNKCRFEPSCSQYMILSIQKYGLLKGLKKGVGRLKRCNVQDGGYDFP